MRPRRFGRQWGWPKRWFGRFKAIGWRECDNWSRHTTWRRA